MCTKCYNVVFIQLPEDARTKSMGINALCVAQITPPIELRSMLGDSLSRESVGDCFEGPKRDHVHRYRPKST